MSDNHNKEQGDGLGVELFILLVIWYIFRAVLSWVLLFVFYAILFIIPFVGIWYYFQTH